MINIKIDSRKVCPGDTFVAIKGNNVDGHDFIKQAIDNGATTIVVEREVDYPVNVVRVPDTSKYLVDEIVSNYQEEVNRLNIIGITGTNGKTTTAYLVYQMLNALGYKTAYIGTIGFYLPNKDVKLLPNTTPVIVDLYNLLLEAKEDACVNVVMEVSSHALDQERVKGLKFKIGAYTNLTQDHLDYHHTMENYLDAKLKLLNQLEGPMLVNADDEYISYWDKPNFNYPCYKYGYKADKYRLISFENMRKGTYIKFEVDGKSYEVNTNMKGEFNVYNYLAALAIANSMNVDINDIIEVTKDVYAPKGRSEIITFEGCDVIVDYAHTPDAVLKIISSFSKITNGKVFTLIGCGGDRDATKRPIMGRIATENSDFVVFTSDNPRTEEPKKILEDILEGVTLNNYEVIEDRKEAIRYILSLLKEKDIALILGKGHEDYQIIGTKKIHFDDAEEVRKYISQGNMQ